MTFMQIKTWIEEKLRIRRIYRIESDPIADNRSVETPHPAETAQIPSETQDPPPYQSPPTYQNPPSYANTVRTKDAKRRRMFRRVRRGIKIPRRMMLEARVRETRRRFLYQIREEPLSSTETWV